MAKVRINRNIILSLKDFFDPILASDGYDFSFVSAWADDDKIVKPEDYVSGQGMIKLPAGKMSILSRRQGDRQEIGSGKQNSIFYINLFIHAITEGQLYDLLDLFNDSLTDSNNTVGDLIIPINDYTTTGYPTNSPVKIYDMEISNVQGKAVFGLGEENIALNYAGIVGFMGTILRSPGV